MDVDRLKEKRNTMTKKYTDTEKFRGYRGYHKCGTNLILPALFVVLVLSAFAHQCYGLSIASTPKISASPASLNFGNVKSGETSLPKTILVKNSGTSDLVIGSIAITGANAAEFSQTNDCTNVTAGASCVISGTFAPTLPFGKKSAIVSITSNDPVKSVLNVKVSGSAPPPKISASPASLNFGNVKSGETSLLKTILVKNSGTSDLVIGSIAITGANAADFSQTNDCTNVTAGASCVISGAFAPTLPFGKKSAIMRITSNDPVKSILNVKVSGSAPPPKISTSPASLNFGSVRPGATSLLKTILVKNTGTSDLVIGSIAITGTNATEFSQTNNCTKIMAGASCVISGTFAPTPPSGNKSAVVSITSNDLAKLTVNVKLSGSSALVPRDVGAVLQTSGVVGALMVGGKAGEMLLPMVDRDASGNPTKVTGALYMNNDTGNSAVVYLGEDGRPARTVMGDFILLFSNWSANGTTVNIAKIYTPTGYIEVFKGVNVNANMDANNANGEVPSYIAPMTCLPVCGNDTRTLAELLKLSGLLISDGLCVAAIPASLGAMALPCAGAVVSTASFLMGDEAWLGIQGMDAGFLAMDAAECVGEKNALSCVSFFSGVGSQILDIYGKEVDDNSALVDVAFAALTDPGQPSGVIQQGGGLPVVPSGEYECTPGGAMHYAPCLVGGVRECRSDYTWSPCEPVPVCGNGKCESGETSFNCPGDCADRTCASRDKTCCTMVGGSQIQQIKSPKSCGHCPNDNTTYAGYWDDTFQYRVCDCDDCRNW
jgi:hypothetical protein